MNTTIKNLKSLNTIEPSDSFRRGLKAQILSTPQNKGIVLGAFYPTIIGAGIFSIIAVITIYSVGKLGKTVSPAYASLNQNEIQTEFEALQLSITLEEIEYSNTVHNTIASALTEISNDTTIHLNTRVIEKENNDLKINEDQNNHIDSMLNSVIF
jgi:hypothetical protein